MKHRSAVQWMQQAYTQNSQQTVEFHISVVPHSCRKSKTLSLSENNSQYCYKKNTHSIR